MGSEASGQLGSLSSCCKKEGGREFQPPETQVLRLGSGKVIKHAVTQGDEEVGSCSGSIFNHKAIERVIIKPEQKKNKGHANRHFSDCENPTPTHYVFSLMITLNFKELQR